MKINKVYFLTAELGVEFGPKVSLSHVDSCVFLDEFNHDNYSEARTDIVEKQVKNYEERFGRLPDVLIADQAYGSRENRTMLEGLGIRVAFKPLGRKSRDSVVQENYVRRKQRWIEGDIGDVKEHYGCAGIHYHYREGSEMWVRFGLLARNLKMAAVRMA